MKKWFLFIILCVLALTSEAGAYSPTTCLFGETGTCYSTSGSFSDVSAAVSQCTAATDDTTYVCGVYIQAGSSNSWGSNYLTPKRGMVLAGMPFDRSSKPTISGGGITMSVNHFRVTNINFSSNVGINRNGTLTGTKRFRFDHNVFTGNPGGSVWMEPCGRYDPMYGTCSGLFDSNTFNVTIDAGTIIEFDSSDYGSRAQYELPIDWGANDTWMDNWLYIEGNTFNVTGSGELFENNAGGRMAHRFNTYNLTIGAGENVLYEQHNSSKFGALTCGDENITGGKAHEAYNNYVNGPVDEVTKWRTGTGMLHDNVFNGSATAVLQNYRAYDGCTGGSTENCSDPSLGTNRLTRCCSSSYTSGGLQGEGYPCIEGFGQGAVGVSEPGIFYNNWTKSGSSYSRWSNVDPWETYSWAMQADRDWCVSNSKPGSCGGVALSYTPLQCPHPLATDNTGSCDYSLTAGGYPTNPGVAGYNVGDAVPYITTASIGTSGTVVSINFSETVVMTDYDTGELHLNCSTTGTVNLSSPSGSGSAWSFTAASTIQNAETCTLDLSADANSIEDATANDVVNIDGVSVTNNSTQGASTSYHWVSTTGSAAWASCVGATDPGVYCSLNLANTSLTANQTVMMKAGTYNSSGEYINPSNSGTITNPIRYQAYDGAITISGRAYGVYLVGKSYIEVIGYSSAAPITVTSTTSQPLLISNGHHNTIQYVTFNNLSDTDYWGSEIVDSSTYNWIKNCTFHNQNSGGVLSIGTEDSDSDATAYNLIENCTIYNAEHSGLAVMGRYNIVRNNLIENYDGHQRPLYFYGSTNNARNIIEGNRISYAPLQTDSSENDNVTYSMSSSIFRYNVVMKATGSGLGMYRGSGYLIAPQNNTIYNNTIWQNFADGSGSSAGCGGAIYFQVDTGTTHIMRNAFKNNIVYGNDPDVRNPPWKTCSGTYAPLSEQTFANNWIDSDGDPLFVSTSGTDPLVWTPPDLNLQSGSRARDFGGALTTVASGCGGTTLTLAAATSSAPQGSNYFQDGTFAPSGAVSADWVAIGTVSNVVQISSVNYTANTISFASAPSCTNGQSVWLYKKSDGVQVLYGTAPDAGAFEYGSGVDVTYPTVTITTSDPQNIVSDSLYVYGTSEDTVGVTLCKYRIGAAPDDSNGTATNGTTSWNATTSGYSQGANTLYVGCRDAAGNWGTDTITVNRDSVAPTVTITSPTSSATYGTSSSTITLGGTSSSDTSTVTYSNAAGGSGSCTGTTSWTCSSISLVSGSNAITVTGTDAFSNQGTDIITVTYTPPDTTAPAVTITTTDPTNTSLSTQSVAWTATDAVGVTSCKWRLGSAPDAFNGTTDASSPATISGYAIGTNTVYIGCTDAAGNWGSDSITLNYAPPGGGGCNVQGGVFR